MKTKKRKGDVRKRILASARSLFNRNGYTSSGVDLIIKEAGVFKRSFYWHFESKDELGETYLSLEDQFIGETLSAIMLRHKNYSQMIKTWVRATRMSLNKEYKKGCPFANFHSQTLGVQRFQKLTRDILCGRRDRLAEYLRTCEFSSTEFNRQNSESVANRILMLYQGALQMFSVTQDEGFINILEKELLSLEFESAART